MIVHLLSKLRKNRADRGKSRLSSKVDTIIEDAIKKIYLTAEQPHIGAVIEVPLMRIEPKENPSKVIGVAESSDRL